MTFQILLLLLQIISDAEEHDTVRAPQKHEYQKFMSVSVALNVVGCLVHFLNSD
jgi:hypothetical protein